MAVGTATAILGSAALGAGGSLLASRNNSRAIDQASQVQQDAVTQQTNLLRDIFNQNRQDLAPFRDYEIQQRNALGEIFGFNPIGQDATGGGTNPFNPGAGQPNPTGSFNGPSGFGGGRNNLQDFPIVQRGGFETGFIPPEFNGGNEPGLPNGFNFPNGFVNPNTGTNGNPNVTATPLPTTGGTGGTGGFETVAVNGSTNPLEGAVLPNEGRGVTIQTGAPGGPSVNGGVAGISPTIDPSVRGADRFNNSLFNAVFTNNFRRDNDRIDTRLANDGLLYAGVRTNAVENSRAQNFGNALNSYLATLMGAPPAGATQAGVNNANNYAAQSGNLAMQGANAGAQSAYANAANNNNLMSNLFNTGAFALGALG
jgi:hypothetical protein